MTQKSDAEAAISSAPPSVEGWRWVPVEPTKEMQDVGHHETICDHKSSRFPTLSCHRRVYAAMLSAAPVPPQKGETEPVAPLEEETGHWADPDAPWRKHSPPSPAPLDVRADMLAALEPFAAIADLVNHTPARDGETVYRLPNPKGGYFELERKHFIAAREAHARAKGGQP